MLEYDIDNGVRAFTAGRGDVLPCDVTVGHQVHGINVAEVSRMGMTREELEGYDAFVTNVPGCAVGVRTADCIPVLLHDPVRHAVAAVHAGWRGTLQRISQKAVSKMRELYGTSPEDIIAVIGPGISKGSFQVGEEVVMAFRDNGFPMDLIYEWQGVPQENNVGGHHIDLFAANKWILTECGLHESNVRISGIDTFKDSRFHSARREGLHCGRNINAIMLL